MAVNPNLIAIKNKISTTKTCKSLYELKNINNLSEIGIKSWLRSENSVNKCRGKKMNRAKEKNEKIYAIDQITS